MIYLLIFQWCVYYTENRLIIFIIICCELFCFCHGLKISFLCITKVVYGDKENSFSRLRHEIKLTGPFQFNIHSYDLILIHISKQWMKPAWHISSNETQSENFFRVWDVNRKPKLEMLNILYQSVIFFFIRIEYLDYINKIYQAHLCLYQDITNINFWN